jgi:hypothetical protein
VSRGDLLGLGLVLATAVGGLGWVALRGAGRGETAADPVPEPQATPEFHSGRRTPAAEFVPALAEEPGLPEELLEWNRSAIRALEAGDLAGAVELFEAAFARAPEVAVLRTNLAEALARLARRERERRESAAQALERLARAVELAPEREDLAAELARWREIAEVEADFWREESTHFHVAYDGSRQDLLHGAQRTLIDVAEEAYLDFGELFGRFPVTEGRPKLQIVVYRREEFAALTGVGDWAAGAFDGVVRIPLEDLDRERDSLRRVLRHELAHAYVLEVGGSSVPGWLNEGLAQWLEESRPSARQAQVRRARERLRGKQLFPLDSLRGSLAGWSDPEAIAIAYAQSLALVDHLAVHQGERLLFELVAGCAQGQSPVETFRDRMLYELHAVVSDLASSVGAR